MKQKRITRPLLETPADHPLRKEIEENTGKWITNPDDVKIFCTMTHEVAEEILRRFMPEAFEELAKKPADKNQLVVAASHITDDGRFLLVHAHHVDLTDDDPGKLECGWAATLVIGDLTLKETYEDLLANRVKMAFPANQGDPHG